MIQTKKGIATTVLAVLIISIVIGVVMITVFTGVAQAIGGGGVNNALVDLCHFNAKFRDSVSAHRLVPFILCPEKGAWKVTVHANAWKKCDPDKLFDLKKKNDKKTCATLQVAQLAKTCFDMYGSSAWTLTAEETGKYGCFKIELQNLGTQTINEIDMNRAMLLLGTDNGYCGHKADCGKIKEDKAYFNNNDCAAYTTDDCDEGKRYNCGNCDNTAWYGDLKSKELRDAELKTQKGGLENVRDTIMSIIKLIDAGKDYTKHITDIKTSAPLLTSALGTIPELSSALDTIDGIINRLVDWTGEVAKIALKTSLNTLLLPVNLKISELDKIIKDGSYNLMCYDERSGQHDAVLVNDAGCPTS